MSGYFSLHLRGAWYWLSHICVSEEERVEIYIIDQVESNFTKPFGLIKDLSDERHITLYYHVLQPSFLLLIALFLMQQ